MKIRRIDLSDLSDLVEISDWSKADFTGFMNKPNAKGLALVRPTGHFEVVNGYVLYFDRHGKIEIVDIAIRPSCRRQGWGTRLLHSIPGHIFKAAVFEHSEIAIQFFIKNEFRGNGVDHRESGDFWVFRKEVHAASRR